MSRLRARRAGRGSPEGRGAALAWVALGLASASLYGPALWAHLARARQPHVFNDDARVLVQPFYRYVDAETPVDDPLASYFLAGLPEGYRALYFAAAKLWDPIELSELLPYATLAALCIAVAIAARRLAGFAAAFGAVALVLGSGVFLARMSGGLPRSFAYPVLAAAVASLATGRPFWLAGSVLAGAAFYPATAVVAGLALAGWLLLLPASDRGDGTAWSLRRRLLLVGTTGALAAALLAPVALRLRAYGPPISPAAIHRYPEAGPGGRFGPDDRAPFPSYLDAAAPLARETVIGAGAPWFPRVRAALESHVGLDTAASLLLLVSAIGWGRLAWLDGAARRVILLPASALVGYAAACAFAPHLFLPQRYVQYPVPLLTALGVAVGFRGLAPGATSSLVGPVAALAGNLLVVALFGGRGSDRAGLNVVVPPAERRLYQAVAALPESAVIAGWPQSIDSLPYETRRTAYLTTETHMPFHEGYADLTRSRMRALIDAYFATSPGPLLRLRDEEGVTHLIVHRSHLRERPPEYFRPFDADLARAVAAAQGRRFELERQLGRAAVAAAGDAVLLDLARLGVSGGGTRR
jgi:hypothetical protein